MLQPKDAGMFLLSGILQEANQAKETTMWSPFPASIPRITQNETFSPATPYLFIPSFGEARKQTSVRAPRSPGQRGRTPKISTSPNVSAAKQAAPKSPTKKEQTQLQQQKNTIPPEHPQKTIMHEENGETWTLRCVCNLLSGDGLLVVCEKCQCWQHAICMGLNDHTIPEHYFCDICANKRIRCKCGNNLDFRSAIIQCSRCHNYVHKKCEGLGYGMVPKGNFVCHFCGKSEFHFEKPVLDASIKVDDTQTVTFSQPKIEDLPSEFLSGPFSDFLKQDLVDTTLPARDFCEMLYDRFRSFFFITNPRYPSNTSRKKRNKLVGNFIRACMFLCRTFYGITDEQFVQIVNALIYQDIFFDEPIKTADDPPFSLTETAILALPRLTSVVRFAAAPRAPQLKQLSDGRVVCATDLVANDFVYLVTDGLVGDIEEFNVESKVGSAHFAIADSRFVLDVSHASNSLLHHIPRSISGNCALRMVQIGDQIGVALFAHRASISSSADDPLHVIRAGTPLTIGIDWIPAVLDDVSKYLSWQFIEEESDSESPPPVTQRSHDRESIQRSNSPSLSASSSRDFGAHGASPTKAYATPEKQKKKQKEEPKKKKRGRQRKNAAQPSTEVTLFSVMMNDTPGDLLFQVVRDFHTVQSQSVDYLNQSFQRSIKETRNVAPRSRTPSTTILTTPPHTAQFATTATTPVRTQKIKSPEHSAQESDESASGDENFHEVTATNEKEINAAENDTKKALPEKEKQKLSEEEENSDENTSESKIENKSETKIESKSETKIENKSETKIENKVDNKNETGNETKTKTQTQTDTKVETKIEAKTETQTDTKAETKLEPQQIFSDAAMDKLTKGLRKVSYKGLKMSDPSDDMKQILGL